MIGELFWVKSGEEEWNQVKVISDPFMYEWKDFVKCPAVVVEYLSTAPRPLGFVDITALSRHLPAMPVD